MAILMMDGFNHYVTADITKKWDASSAGTITQNGGRGGRGMITVGSGGYLQKNLSATKQTLILGAAINQVNAYSINQIITFGSAANTSVGINLKSDGSVAVYRVSTLLGTSAPGVISPVNTWNYIEAKVVCHATTGAVEVRVNGVSVLTLTNVNTDQAATGYHSFVQFGSSGTTPGNAGNCKYSDFYLLDTTGARNVDFLGDSKVESFVPVADGATTQFTPTPSGTHYTAVDESAPSGTDYITGTTSGDTDLFDFADIATNPLSVFGVQVCASAYKSDAGNRKLRAVSRVSGTTYDGATDTPLIVDTRYVLQPLDSNPATAGAWTKADVNGAQFGVRVV